MKAPFKIIILLLILIYTSDFSFARNYYFRHYTNENGLSHNTVFCSLQDKNGFMWFGTKDGANRFDGHSFKIYQHEPGNPKSIKSNYVNGICEDMDGLIWVATNNGVSYYDPLQDYFFSPDSLLHESDNTVLDIKADLQGNVWIQSFGGLYKYNKAGKKTDFYSSETYFMPMHICISSSGTPWFISSDKFLYRYNYKENDFTRYSIISEDEKISYIDMPCLADAGSYGLLIGTEKAGLKRFDPNSGDTKTILLTDDFGKTIFIRTILKYSDDEYWIGSESGIYIFNIKTGSIVNLRKNQNDRYGLSDNAIYTLTKDYEGGIWAGTYFKGIEYLSPDYTPFEKIFDRGDAGSIKGDAIREIDGDQYGNLWIGTEDNGLNKYNNYTGKYTHYVPDGKPGSISGSNIHGLMVDGSKLWIGHFNKGVEILDIPSGKVIKHYEAGKGENDLKTNFIAKIYKTSDGTILLGTLSGVFRYNPQSDNFTFLEDMAHYTFTYSMCEDRNHTIWTGTFGEGLYFKTKDGKTGNYRFKEKDTNTISSNDISDIFEDSRSRLWIGTRGNGLCELDRSTGNFKRHTIQDGFPSNFVYKILEDGTGNLWISTSKGLLRYNPVTQLKRRYSKSDGITNNQFNYSSGYKDQLGKMYFGTIDGMIAFMPDNMIDDKFTPPVYITGFQVFNEELNILSDNEEQQSVTFVDKITLPYNNSTFSIDFAALSYTSPEMNEYMYILEGADKHWTHLTTYRKAYYTNLSPGEYTFRLKASNGSGQWSKQERTLKIIINPPFWKTPWAYLMYIALAGGLIYLILRFYTQRLKDKNKHKLEKMEDLKQKEILTAKIEFFTNIAHEIRTPLTLIKGPLDRILRSGDNYENTKDNLLIMQKNTKRLLDLSNQLLDFRKTEMEEMKLNFIKTDISELLQDTYIRFTPVAEEKQLDFTLSLSEDHYEAIVDKEALTKIISNLFSNALKFAKGKIQVNLETNQVNETFYIRVNSDGNLIPDHMQEKIFEPFFQYKENDTTRSPQGTGIGLYLARSLAQLHKGQLYLDAAIKDCNSFVISLPQKQEVFIDLKTEETGNYHSDTKEDIDPDTSSKSDSRPLVLIVEDEKEMQDFIADELSKDYLVLRCGNGKEAISILETRSVSIIISDVSMPVMDGLELCQKLKSNINYSHIPFVLLSAKHNLQAQIEGLEHGADAYIGKPFSTEHLLAQMSNLLRNRTVLMDNFARSPLVYSNTIAPSKADEKFLKELNEIILENMSNPDLNVDYLAECIGISTSSLYRKMKGICEMNPKEFIRITRLKKAADLLVNEQISVKEVAYITGFSAPSYFSSSFLKQFGMKPSEFVKKQKNT